MEALGILQYRPNQEFGFQHSLGDIRI